jgi:hypothetical protein
VPSETNKTLLYSLNITDAQPWVDHTAQHDLYRTQADVCPPELLHPLLHSSPKPLPICDTPTGTNITLNDVSIDSAVGSDCEDNTDAMTLAQPGNFGQSPVSAHTFNSNAGAPDHDYNMDDKSHNPWAATSVLSLGARIKSTSSALKQRSARAAQGRKDAVCYRQTHAPPRLPTDGCLIPEPAKGHGQAGYHTGWYLHMGQAQWRQIIVSIYIICVAWHCLTARLIDQRLQACREASGYQEGEAGSSPTWPHYLKSQCIYICCHVRGIH